MRAERLKMGGTIGLAAPCHLADAERYKGFIDGIRRAGFNVKESRRLYGNAYGYGATERERAEDINELVLDGDVGLILFGGGNIGCEPIPYIDYEAIKAHPKLFSSYSNGTSILSAIYAQTGLEVYYGGTPGAFADLSHYNYLQFMRAFVEPECDSFLKYSAWRAITPGVCEGTLFGGYLGLLPALISNRYCAPERGRDYILFIEDLDKYCPADAVAQNLAFIEQSDLINDIKGVLFGHFSDAEALMLDQILRRFGERYGVPVVRCEDFGHGSLHGIIPMGRAARLDADKPELTYR